MPRGIAHAWKNSGAETGRVLFLYTPARAGAAGGAAADAPPHRVDERRGGGRAAPAPRLGDRRTDASLSRLRGRQGPLEDGEFRHTHVGEL
jgi:hypothetical protein